MLNFDFHNPTKIIFGKNQHFRLPELIASSHKKVLLTYGGGSIIQNGILYSVKEHLKNFDVFEFGGIEANPEYDTLMNAVSLCKQNEIDFVLAIGGGSVIDGTKFICGAAQYDGDAWNVLERKPGCNFKNALSFGTILTLPATGSEANSGAVISRKSLKTKRTMGGPMFFPQFSICDPQVVASLPKVQIVNGIVDSFVHTLEQYLTFPSGNYLQERQAEAILNTLLEVAPKVIADPSNYNYAANLMWCATHALNGNLRCGVPTDWATHIIGHELTAIFGIDHARTLAIVGPRLMENQLANKSQKLIQYGQRVWGLTGENIAMRAIEKTEEFYQSLGIKTRLSEYTSDYAFVPTEIERRFTERGWTGLGEKQKITPEIAKEIIVEAL